MAQLLPQRGLNEQSPDPLLLTPEEEMEGHWRMAPAAPSETNQRLDHLDGNNQPAHEKKSILNKVKDKAKKLKSKVKKTIKSNHGGSQSGSHEESQEESSEEEEGEDDEEEQHQTQGKSDENVEYVTKALAGLDTFGTRDMLKHRNKSTVEPMRVQQGTTGYNKGDMPTEESTMDMEYQTEDLSRSKETEKDRIERGDAALFTEKEQMETAADIPFLRGRLGEAMAEATESNLGLGKGQHKQDQYGEEKPISSEVGESNLDGKGNVKEAVAPVEDYFRATSEEAEPGKSWRQRASEGVDHGKEKIEEFGVYNGLNSAEKPGDKEESQSLVGKAQDNVKSAVASVEDNFHGTPEKEEIGKSWTQRASEGVGHAKEKLNLAEKPVEGEVQRLPGKAQDKFSEIGEGKELVSDEKPSNFTEEVISGASELGSGVMKKASELAEGLKNVLTYDQSSSKDNVKDIMIEGECKGKEDKGTQQLVSEGEEKAGQTYAQKLYAAKDVIASKLGYSGQTIQENNVIGESKPADQIQGTGAETMEGAKEGKESFKSSIVSKLSPGEDEKALSEAITEAVSNSARSVKDSIVGGFYGTSGKTPSTTDEATGTFQSNTQNISNSSSGGKGIVDRVTGVVGSFLGRKQGEDSEISPSSPKPEPKSVVHVEEQMPEIPKA